MNWKQNLTESLQTEFIFDAPMNLYTTYKAGGAAEVLALPKTEEEIKRALQRVDALQGSFVVKAARAAYMPPL